jgi:hypothetical protein
MSKKHFELLAKYINSIMDPHARLQAAIAVACLQRSKSEIRSGPFFLGL